MEAGKVPRKWWIFITIYLGSLAATLNQFKVPPLMAVLMQALHLDVKVAGWLMSGFALAGFFLALPAGIFLRPYQLKSAGIAGLGALTAGALLGALAPGATLMLVGRVCEGMGLLTMGIVAPSLINAWFPPDERGLPMGIWATWVPAGSVLMLNLANPLYSLGDWRAVWWFGFIMALIAFLVFILIIELPDEFKENKTGSKQAIDWSEIITTWRSRDIWLLAFMFATFNFTIVAYNSWAPTYLKQTFALTPARAAFYTSLVHVGVIPANIVAGWLVNYLKSSRRVYIGGFIVYALAWITAFNLKPLTIIPFMLALGLVAGFIPTATFAAAPVAIGRQGRLPLANAAIMWGQNLGVLLGPVSLGQLLAAGIGWPAGSFLLVPVALLGLITGLLTRIK
nr:MFS transporter [Moorella glycerini]